ncbi:hypothetical protein Pla22_02940 [Rubripirellula amarantea]|uniref:DUF922 domain-containing protein n=2 Tax=Rubripirellula amarantea TaxID=2527999 RepID=A0A5C5WPS0_9BACT|nr:hypothetical protein Pla22_02940 [Rubripirellula amarantea]
MNYGDRDPDQERRSGPRVAAETRFKMEYNYRSSPRWQIQNRESDRVLIIRLRLRDVKLETTHEIWFRRKPKLENFWQDPLVQHELDHVRISSDPRLRKRFLELVGKPGKIELTLEPTDKVDAAFVRQAVQKHVANSFDQVSELASIRYRELDRLTRHGRSPVPAEFQRDILDLPTPENASHDASPDSSETK